MEAKDKGTQELLMVIAKLTLSNAQSNRLLKSIMLECHRLPVDEALVKNVQAATKAFTVKAKEMRDAGQDSEAVRNTLGLPCIHAFNAVLSSIKPTLA